MIYITGDIHGNIKRLMDIDDGALTKNDLVIVLGDFGVIWDNKENSTKILELLGTKNFTTAFVDGNHCNFPLIEQMEEKIDFYGGDAGSLPRRSYSFVKRRSL